MMSNRAKVTISLVLALVLALGANSPAFADAPTPPPGLPPGFTYLYICVQEDLNFVGEGTHVLWLPKSIKSRIQADPGFPWFGKYNITVGRCRVPKEPTVEDLVSGETYDISYGNCGVHIPVASTYGTATLTRVARTGVFPFAHDPCEFSFVNNAGEEVTNFGAPVTYFYNLTHNLYNKFQDGKIGLFVNDGSGWKQCSAMLVGVDLDNGDYGRLACTVNAVGRFALGSTN